MKGLKHGLLVAGWLWLAFCGVVVAEEAKAAKAMAPDAAQDLLIKSEVETAISMLQALHVRQQQGKLTLDQAKELGAALLRELRYGTEGYFWADTKEGVNVALYGRQDVEGRNRLNDQDPNGTYYIKNFLEVAKTGGGYAEYWFTKKGQETPQPKRSYVQAFEPFGWVIGTGYYYPMPETEARRLALDQALSQVKLFAGLTAEERAVLGTVCTIWRAKAGERIIEEGTKLGRMLVILGSPSEVRLKGKLLATLPEQSLVGEVEFLDGFPASADVTLIKESNLLEINHAALHELMKQHPRMGFVIMGELARIASQRLRANNNLR